MKNDHHIAIVILNFNGWRDTLRCLASLRNARHCKRTIFVVDNGSSDNSPSFLRSELQAQQREILIAKHRNEGFPGGMNTGLRFCIRTDAEYYFLVNNDTIIEPEVLHELADYLDHNRDVGVAGPRVHRMSNPDLPHDPALAENTQPVDLPHLLGCAFMLRPEVPREVGFLDETYFLYWDEKDYWQRAIRGGYRVVYVPTHGRVLHEGGASTAKLMSHSSYLYLRNEFLFRRRYPTHGGSLPRLVLKTASRIVKWRVHPRRGIQALVDGLMLWIRNPGPRWRYVCCDPSIWPQDHL